MRTMLAAKARCLIVVGVAALSAPGCGYHANRLAGVGAATGAVAGAAIGRDAEAAAIGTAIGAASGAAVGASIDEQSARNQAYIAEQMGRRLEGGRVGDPVAGIGLAGNARDLLDSIEAVGDDLRLMPGGNAASSVLLRDMAVSGE